MKNIKIISILFLLILFSSCGFKAVTTKNNHLIYLQNIKVIGEPKIAYSLKNNISIISSKDSKNRYDAKVKIEKKKSVKIKDVAGKIKRNSLTISANLELTNLDTNQKIRKTFSKNADYDVSAIHSDTISAENKAVKNITQQISDDILNFIYLNMRK